MGFLEALLALCFLIFFHELGHFCVARYFGVCVEVFSIGFGPKILTKKIGQTKYAISAIPLGGYVKLKGQDDLDPLKKDSANDSFSTKPAYQKMLILFAGPFFNFILAFIIYLIVGTMGVKTLSPKLDTPKENSPASAAKLQKGDVILSIDGKQIHSWEDIAIAIANAKEIKDGDKKLAELTFVIKRESSEISQKNDSTIKDSNATQQILEIKIAPQITLTKNMFNEEISRPIIGITPLGEVIEQKFGGFGLVAFALDECKKSSVMIFEGIKKLVLGVIPLGEIGGVVGIVNIMADIAPSGFVAFGLLVALISINLAVLNLLPIPALDGGQMLITLYEGLSKKPINEQVLYIITIAGWSLLLGLMLLGLYNDFSRIFPDSLQALPRIEP
ncbi:RIP metalloprotease RseP [Helicobacter sp. T3_23-1059]